MQGGVRRGMRRRVGAISAAAVVLSMFSPLSGAAGAVAAAATPELERSGAVTAESAASELAAETGRQEEVLTRRTEVSQLFAKIGRAHV